MALPSSISFGMVLSLVVFGSLSPNVLPSSDLSCLTFDHLRSLSRNTHTVTAANEFFRGVFGALCCCRLTTHTVHFHLIGLSEHRVENTRALMKVMEEGSAIRHSGSTAANSESSRSHAILQICIRCRKRQCV